MEKKTKKTDEETVKTVNPDTTEELSYARPFFRNVGIRTELMECSPQAEPFSEELPIRRKMNVQPTDPVGLLPL